MISCCCSNQPKDSSEGHLSTSGPDTEPPGGTDSQNDSSSDSPRTFHIDLEGLRKYILLKQQEEKIINEKRRQELEEFKKEVEEQQEKLDKLIKAQKEHDLKFKNGKIFLPDYRTSTVNEVKAFLDFIKDNIQGIDVTTPLDEESNQDISNIFNDINRELQGIQEEIEGIEKCLSLPEKSPRINYAQEAKDLDLAKGLVKNLKEYKQELCNLFASRRQELNNPELEAAYKD
jgi:hypothetical protein